MIVPLGISLPNDWDFGTQFETDFETNRSENGTHLNYLASATISHPLFSGCEFFTEALISRETELRSDEYFLDGGLVYELMKNLKLDSGIFYGLKNGSLKVFFIGLSFRY